MKKKYKKLLKKDLLELINLGNNTYKKYCKNKFEVCSIINAKSGSCSEDCKYCAQSSFYNTKIEKYSLISEKEILKQAKIAEKNKAEMFGIVTSGKKLSDKEISKIASAIKIIINEINIKPCVSLGSISEKQIVILKKAGLQRYHHNIETSSNFYPKIVSTHTFDDRIKTIKLLKNYGFQICSGGIIGLGESFEDRINMAEILYELNVDSVPLNILVPIKGTPLENSKLISIKDILKTIAIFRIILKNKIIKIAAGRESILKDFQSLAFLAGANGMLIGGYLTVKGRKVKDDLNMIENLKHLISYQS